MALDFLDNVKAELVYDNIIVRMKSEPMSKLISRIPGSHLLMLRLPCLPDLALRTCVELPSRAL